VSVTKYSAAFCKTLTSLVFTATKETNYILLQNYLKEKKEKQKNSKT
jgi:glutathione synthase/RimK-type ligase-like ATP-grasp enzyme